MHVIYYANSVCLISTIVQNFAFWITNISLVLCILQDDSLRMLSNIHYSIVISTGAWSDGLVFPLTTLLTTAFDILISGVASI